jgi:hypothetical protein
MSDTSGMGFGTTADTSQSDTARRNQSERQGDGRLLGDRASRDRTTDAGYLKRSIPPPPMPPSSAARWSPRQDAANPKSPRL